MAKFAVVIPSLVDVDKDYLKVCVESLRDSGFQGQIIVVANGSRNTKPIQNGEITGISTLLVTKQQGQCNAVNLGAQYASPDTEYIMVSNSDMYYAPGWDKNLKFKYPVFSPNLVEPTNNAGSAMPFVKFDGGFTLDEFKKKEVNKFIKSAVNDAEASRETGFNLPFFIRRDIWLSIGGYDLKYDPWGSNSDTDLQTKINLAGVTPMRLRDVLVYHFSNKSGTFDGSHQDAWQKNWDYFDKKWGFNRDTLGSDVWYNKDMLPEDINDCLYQPDWVMKYYEDEEDIT